MDLNVGDCVSSSSSTYLLLRQGRLQRWMELDTGKVFEQTPANPFSPIAAWWTVTRAGG